MQDWTEIQDQDTEAPERIGRHLRIPEYRGAWVFKSGVPIIHECGFCEWSGDMPVNYVCEDGSVVAYCPVCGEKAWNWRVH